MAQRLLDYPRPVLITGSVNPFMHQFSQFFLFFSGGFWKKFELIERQVMERAMDEGLFSWVPGYLFVFGLWQIESGRLTDAKETSDNLLRLSNEYNDKNTSIQYHIMGIILSLKRGDFDAANGYSTKYFSEFGSTTGEESRDLLYLSIKGVLETLSGRCELAEKAVHEAQVVYNDAKTLVPHYKSYYFKAVLLYLIHVKKSDLSRTGLKWKGSDYGKLAVKNNEKVAYQTTETYRLMAIYYWLVNKQKKALKWFDKSIKEGEKLGARPDLSRTYMEVGKRLKEQKSKYKHLNGITADEYLDKAEKLFKEMDLQWDLEQLEKVRQGIPVPIS